MIFLQIRDGLICLISDGKVINRIGSWIDYDKFIEWLGKFEHEPIIQMSSTINWPEDETDDEEVIAICHHLNGSKPREE